MNDADSKEVYACHLILLGSDRKGGKMDGVRKLEKALEIHTEY
jgi:hypothetical protein